MEYYLIFSVPQALLFWFLHFPLQLSKSTLSPDGVEEILDTRLVGTCNPEEVRSLARIAHQCLHKTPRKRPSLGVVSQAILKIKERRLIKEINMSFAEDFKEAMSRIEYQELELKRLARIDEGLIVWYSHAAGEMLKNFGADLILRNIWAIDLLP